jgi:DNA-binding CsgD family transcriptional regulator
MTMTTCDDTLHIRERLTPRECEVMDWLVMGYTNREIADRLGNRESTVEYMAEQSYDKLGASNRVQAAVLYIRYYWGGRPSTFWKRWLRDRKERDPFRAQQKANTSRRVA